MLSKKISVHVFPDIQHVAQLHLSHRNGCVSPLIIISYFSRYWVKNAQLGTVYGIAGKNTSGLCPDPMETSR
jgi:hypothetical protein